MFLYVCRSTPPLHSTPSFQGCCECINGAWVCVDMTTFSHHHFLSNSQPSHSFGVNISLQEKNNNFLSIKNQHSQSERKTLQTGSSLAGVHLTSLQACLFLSVCPGQTAGSDGGGLRVRDTILHRKNMSHLGRCGVQPRQTWERYGMVIPALSTNFSCTIWKDNNCKACSSPCSITGQN